MPATCKRNATRASRQSCFTCQYCGQLQYCVRTRFRGISRVTHRAQRWLSIERLQRCLGARHRLQCARCRAVSLLHLDGAKADLGTGVETSRRTNERCHGQDGPEKILQHFNGKSSTPCSHLGNSNYFADLWESIMMALLTRPVLSLCLLHGWHWVSAFSYL